MTANSNVPIYFFNTLTHKKEQFTPIEPNHVKLYCCGPTVYLYAHIGNMRTYTFEDTLRRTLEHNGYKVTHVMNITDVGHLTSDADTGEDKMELRATKERKTVWQIAQHYTDAFFRDTAALHILKPTIIPKATDHIQDMIQLIQKLEQKGYTYTIDTGVYFDTSKLPDYGKLTGMNFEKLNETLKAGARVEYNPQKRNITDFGLWLFSPKDKKRQMEWTSPWGVGFPGWHIECSTMSMKYLGEHFDIHASAIDHIPVHHTNEIAQSEAATGTKVVNYWLHGAFLVFGEKEKMAKSKGEILTVKDITEKGYDPLALRYLYYTAHYRSELLFTWESLQSSQKALNTLREHARKLKQSTTTQTPPSAKAQTYRQEFLEAINDDLDMPKALTVLWKLVREEKDVADKEKYELLMEFDTILALDLAREEAQAEVSAEAQELIQKREEARRAKDYATADVIREQLKSMGVIIEDTPQGVRVKIEKRQNA